MPIFIHKSVGKHAKMVYEVLEETRMLAWTMHLTDHQNDIMSDDGWLSIREAYKTFLGDPINQTNVAWLKSVNNTILFLLLDTIKILNPTNTPSPGKLAGGGSVYQTKVPVSNPSKLQPFLDCLKFDSRTILVIRANSEDKFGKPSGNPSTGQVDAFMFGPLLVLYDGFFQEEKVAALSLVHPSLEKNKSFELIATSKVVTMYRELTCPENIGKTFDVPVPISALPPRIADDAKNPQNRADPLPFGIYSNGEHVTSYFPWICHVLAQRSPKDAIRNAQNIALYAARIWVDRVYPESHVPKGATTIAKGLCDSRFDGQRYVSLIDSSRKMRHLPFYNAEEDAGKDEQQPFKLTDQMVAECREPGDVVRLPEDAASMWHEWEAVVKTDEHAVRPASIDD